MNLYINKFLFQTSGKISAETFGDTLNTIIAIYEARKSTKERKQRTESLKISKTILKGISFIK